MSAGIGRLRLLSNDLDFRYLAVVKRSKAQSYAEMRAVIDVSRFYSRGADHFILAMDCEGGQGSNNPHCGPIVRDGKNLFAVARGVFVNSGGDVVTETWDGTFAPERVQLLNQRPGTFDPTAHTCLNVHVRCHYAGGIDVRIRKGLAGSVVFEGSTTSAPWAFTGQMRACIGGIALGFIAPQDTGCVEQIEPRSAPEAKLGYAVFSRLG